MEISREILSSVVTYMKYAKYLPDLFRRESWEETVLRNMMMHIKKYPTLEDEIVKNFRFVFNKKVLPSMRGLQFGGKPIELAPNRQYNCAFLHIDDWRAFSEVMFLLLGGTGLGYSVQKHHVEKLPEIKKPSRRTRRYLISDSIEGWADSVKVLMRAYFFGASDPVFDFSDIRPKGTPLKTSGGKAPGAQPLKDCLHNLRKVLDTKEVGDKLTTLEVHDMVCYIADAVLSGGIRRAALLSLFSFGDEDMMTCKYGSWYEKNPQRGRSNNAVCLLRHKIKKKSFYELWEKIKASCSGEPSVYFSNNAELGQNPCGEVSLKHAQFCNLSTINVSDILSQEDFNDRAKAAAFIGTLQAGYTDFHYLRDEWKETTEKDALIGVSMTGIASGMIFKYNITQAAEIVVKENKRIAELIGINPAARTTVVKPEGSSSLALGTSSGIHAWHSQYYIRRIRVSKGEPIYSYFIEKLPKLIEDDFFKPTTQAIISIPVKAPEGAIFRDEPVTEMMERIKYIYEHWIIPGHRKGDNTHNVSSTVSIKEDEWQTVRDWMWENRKYYNGISVLPWDGGTYVQTPFEECDQETYEKMLKHIKFVDLTEVVELEDLTQLKEQAACAGGACAVE
jgi:ribonucleoside-diphosphate reductase alpha chain